MNPAVLIAIISLVGVLVTQLVIYLVARRSKSGRIITSEAETLWAESANIRATLTTELASVRQELKEAREEIRRAEQACEDCQAQLRRISRGYPWQGTGDERDDDVSGPFS